MKTKTVYIWMFLLLVAAFWLFTFLTLNFWLEPYSAAYAETGQITAGYLAYAFIGMVFSTPAPFLSVLILLQKVSLDRFDEVWYKWRKLYDQNQIGSAAPNAAAKQEHRYGHIRYWRISPCSAQSADIPV